jgi:hypothetical protein
MTGYAEMLPRALGVSAAQHLQAFGSLLALALGFESISRSLLVGAKRFDSYLVWSRWFGDFCYSHQVFICQLKSPIS